MYVTDSKGRKFLLPTPEENETINRGIALDPDTFEADEEWFKRAARGRPVIEHPKKAVNIRLDQDVLAHFRAKGKRWQTRINRLLRDEMERELAAQPEGQPERQAG
jgi:uncharacterized protein (DUF4415 family)